MSDTFPSDERQSISFPTWKIELESVAAGQRGSLRMHLLDLLRYAKSRHAPVTIALVKQYLADGRGGRDGTRPALRWFCSGERVVPENWKSGKREGGKVENWEIWESRRVGACGRRGSGAATGRGRGAEPQAEAPRCREIGPQRQ